ARDCRAATAGGEHQRPFARLGQPRMREMPSAAKLKSGVGLCQHVADRHSESRHDVHTEHLVIRYSHALLLLETRDDARLELNLLRPVSWSIELRRRVMRHLLRVA